MPILNYTTTIAVSKTLGEIQEILARHGARSITVEYDDVREPAGVEFVIATPFGERLFRLPANVAGVAKALERQYHAGNVPRRFVNAQQASRVGWRIVKDWVEAQAAIIEAGMVTMDEVFLPYLLDEGGRTVYQDFVERGLKLLPERSEGR